MILWEKGWDILTSLAVLTSHVDESSYITRCDDEIWQPDFFVSASIIVRQRDYWQVQFKRESRRVSVSAALRHVPYIFCVVTSVRTEHYWSTFLVHLFFYVTWVTLLLLYTCPALLTTKFAMKFLLPLHCPNPYMYHNIFIISLV